MVSYNERLASIGKDLPEAPASPPMPTTQPQSDRQVTATIENLPSEMIANIMEHMLAVIKNDVLIRQFIKKFGANVVAEVASNAIHESDDFPLRTLDDIFHKGLAPPTESPRPSAESPSSFELFGFAETTPSKPVPTVSLITPEESLSPFQQYLQGISQAAQSGAVTPSKPAPTVSKSPIVATPPLNPVRTATDTTSFRQFLEEETERSAKRQRRDE